MAFGQPPLLAPVAFEQDDHPNLSRNLERALANQLESEIQGLVSAKDWADFERRRGSINGLKSAIALCQQERAKLEA